MLPSTSSERFARISAIVPPLLAALIYGLAYLGRGIIDADEANYVHAAQRMIETGDWITPYANGLRYLNKPPLLIWLVAGSFQLFGISEWAARLPGLIGIVATTWLVQRIASRAAGPLAGFSAGLAFAFCIGTTIFTLEVMTDIVLVFCLTLAMHCFLVAQEDSFRPLKPVIGFFVATAAAFMTKSLVGVAFPCGIVVLYLLVTRSRPSVSWKQLALGCGVFVVLVVPWHIAAEVRNPGFLENVIVNHQVLRFLGEMPTEDYLSVPVWLFWVLILAWLFPWTFFLPAALADREKSKPVLLSLCWAGLVLAFFTVSDRLEHYAFPILPALAIPIGAALASRSRWVHRGFLAAALIGILLLIAYTGAAGLLHRPDGAEWEKPPAEQMTDYSLVLDLPDEILAQLLGWPLAVAVFGIAAGLIAAGWLDRKGRRVQAVVALAVAMVVFVLAAARSIRVCEPVVSSRAFGEELAALYQPGDRVVIIGDFWSGNSINFYAPLRLYIHDGRAQSFRVAMEFPDAPQLVLSREELDAMWRGPERTFVLGEPEKVAALDLPGAHTVLESGGRVLISNQEK